MPSLLDPTAFGLPPAPPSPAPLASRPSVPVGLAAPVAPALAGAVPGPVVPSEAGPASGGFDTAKFARLFAIGLGIGRGPHGGGAGILRGVADVDARRELEARERLEIEAAEQKARDDENKRLAAAEAQRRKGLAGAILDAQKQSRGMSRPEHEQFVSWVDRQLVAQGLAQPGELSSAVPYVSPALSKRAADKIADLQVAWKRNGFDPSRMPRFAINFDVDGDGVDERVPFQKLEEYAGVASFDATTGERIEAPAPTAQTYGDLFSMARGTALADKPLPVDSKGQPDYSAAVRTLGGLRRAMGATGASGRGAVAVSRREAQQRLRSELYAAVVSGDKDTSAMAGRFTALGLSFRAELVRARERAVKEGRALVAPSDRIEMGAEDYLGRARDAYGVPAPDAPTPGAGAPAAAPAPAPNPSGGKTITRAELQAVAKRLGISTVEAEAHAKSRGLRVVP